MCSQTHDFLHRIAPLRREFVLLPDGWANGTGVDYTACLGEIENSLFPSGNGAVANSQWPVWNMVHQSIHRVHQKTTTRCQCFDGEKPVGFSGGRHGDSVYLRHRRNRIICKILEVDSGGVSGQSAERCLLCAFPVDVEADVRPVRHPKGPYQRVEPFLLVQSSDRPENTERFCLWRKSLKGSQVDARLYNRQRRLSHGAARLEPHALSMADRHNTIEDEVGEAQKQSGGCGSRWL